MDLKKIIDMGISPALALLPAAMDTQAARVMLLAIGLQESRFLHRRQIGGPARGFWQFEKGTRASRGGVWGVYLHAASRNHLAALCKARSVACDPDAIYAALEYDDVLAAGVARLLLWTDPKALPAVGDADAGWVLYLRTWRPGRQHPKTWPALYAQAVAALEA
ncbi:hypothetical protein L7Q78_17830 [Achromobacter xylosoxidans]|uniref:hypothetical protein n=1 Tax=Alcaligenes xylosoxydans xylosoxydans TaxID=85698 RepID=UPI001F0699A4|nr:hypothetical protein [Achromobacter xylosoxidans]MCH1989152.1 hypothetical protein [Achromobacter xylosoxidans]MCH1994649.1 hypothetical protein [Achromobacter xylosoxidans]MCH4589481.1 hypothetical protein [Achromobacter xylosoxidans]